jgi:UDP-N-acetylmuramate dehydrogenase
LLLSEHFLLRPKTTMRIGGTARYFAELLTTKDCEEACTFVFEKHIPLIPLGSGSNTIFSDAEINALVVQVKYADVTVDTQTVTVGAGKNLPMLVNELAGSGLDLTALTGIPGTVGGAIFGNAGQGPKGIWIDSFVESVTVFDGEWKTLPKSECGFGYRESRFKSSPLPAGEGLGVGVIIWEATLKIPKADPIVIKANIESLVKKRIETQPHVKTAGSCFKAVGGTPAWQLIDAAGLRGLKVGGVQVSEKHANFLLNVGEATYADAVRVVEAVKAKVSEELDVEMRFTEPDGSVRF